MKKTTTTLLAVAGMTAMASAATYTWNGTDGSYADAANWGGTVPTSSDTAQISSGTATFDGTGGDLAFAGAGAGLLIDGGTYAQNAGYWMTIDTGATLTVTNGGSFSGPNNLQFRGFGGNAGTHTINNGTVTINTLGADDNQVFNISNGSTFTAGATTLNNSSALNISGATFSATDLTLNSYGAGGFVNLFDGGQLNISGSFTNNANFINFDSASTTGSVFIDNVDVATVQAMVTAGDFGIAGAAETTLSSFSYTINGSGVDIVSSAAVPEPSSTALLGLGGLALILRRRK